MDNLVKSLEKQEKLLTMMIFQLIELNRLMKKLNYISGTDAGISTEELTEEIKFLGEMADCINKKGIMCPITGLVKKFTRGFDKSEEEEFKKEKEIVNEVLEERKHE